MLNIGWLYIDYRLQNSILEGTPYPIPTVSNILKTSKNIYT